MMDLSDSIDVSEEDNAYVLVVKAPKYTVHYLSGIHCQFLYQSKQQANFLQMYTY